MSLPDTIVIATHNAKKRRELDAILTEIGAHVTLLTLDDVPPYPEPVESGGTFSENAEIKARAGVKHTGMATLADDSGLCIDALNGMPGILSARWAGQHGDDAANLQLVLDQLSDLPDERRGAAFVAAVVLVLPDGSVYRAEGSLSGTLLSERRGSNGFGYDPIFLPKGHTRTTAEMSAEEKNALSHRSQALRALLNSVA